MYENVKTVDGGGRASAVTGFLKGALVAALFTLAVFLIFAVVLSYTPLSEGAIPYIVFITQIIGAAIAGFLPAKRVGTGGILTGFSSALLYMLIIWLISSLVSDGFYFGGHILMMFLLSVIAGATGGIMGVNLKSSNNNKKKR